MGTHTQSIEDYLATASNNTNWMTAVTDNESYGDIVTLSGQHLFYILQFAQSSTFRVQIAIGVGNSKLYVRNCLWWGGWTNWTAQ